MTFPISKRAAVIGAALLALFLGALDALVMSAAMPTVVAELGGLELYSWVYSAYFLSRAVSLPIFGKLADLYNSRNLFLTAIATFLIASMAAGCAWNMAVLIVTRVVQGIGAGGLFALVYIVLADVAVPGQRGRTLSMASAIWGIASVLGPTLGGFIVTYFSWRWIFFINLPLGIVSLWGIGTRLTEHRSKQADVSLDLWGVAALTTAVLALLFAFLSGGRTYAWDSPQILGLLTAFAIGIAAFIQIERRARNPILSISFFGRRGFSTGNVAVFLSSVAIFALFAYAPLFLQGAQAKTPMQVGIAMLSLSLGWSIGSISLGQVIDRVGQKYAAVAGAMLLVSGCGMTLTFTADSTIWYSFTSFFIVGVGMGFVGLSTLLVVQSSLAEADLGVATSSNQFARTLGGAVGVGICGGFIAARFSELSESIRQRGLLERLPEDFTERGAGQIERLLQPDVQAMIPPELLQQIQQSVISGVREVFWTVVIAAILCLLVCLLMPSKTAGGDSGQEFNPHRS